MQLKTKEKHLLSSQRPLPAITPMWPPAPSFLPSLPQAPAVTCSSCPLPDRPTPPLWLLASRKHLFFDKIHIIIPTYLSPSSLGWGLWVPAGRVAEEWRQGFQTLPPGGQDQGWSSNLFCGRMRSRARAKSKGSRGALGVTAGGQAHRRHQLLNAMPSVGWKGLLRSALRFCF